MLFIKHYVVKVTVVLRVVFVLFLILRDSGHLGIEFRRLCYENKHDSFQLVWLPAN